METRGIALETPSVELGGLVAVTEEDLRRSGAPTPRCPDCGAPTRSRGQSWCCIDCGRWFLKNPRQNDKGRDYPRCIECGGKVISRGESWGCIECGRRFQKRYRKHMGATIAGATVEVTQTGTAKVHSRTV